MTENQQKKPKGLQLEHKNQVEFITLGKEFIKRYYTFIQQRNYPALNCFIKQFSKFSFNGEKANGNTEILALLAKMYKINGVELTPEQFDVTLSGSRRINVFVIGTLTFVQNNQKVKRRFTEYIHLGQDTDQKMWIQLSMLLTHGKELQDPMGKDFIGKYYTILNNRDYESLKKITRSFSRFSIQNKRLVGEQNILIGLKQILDTYGFKYSNINYDIISFGPERVNILVAGVVTMKNSDSETEIKKPFSEYIHLAKQKEFRKKKKLKKKAIMIAQENVQSGNIFWIQNSITQIPR